jgi:hypothetical protein
MPTEIPMSVVSALPIELWHEILRLACEPSAAPNLSLAEYPYIDTNETRKRHDRASDQRMAKARLISHVCRAWRAIALPLSYTETRLRSTSYFAFKRLLMAHELYPNLFDESRRFVIQNLWLRRPDEVVVLLRTMPRLEWLEIQTDETVPTPIRVSLPRILAGQSNLLYLDLESSRDYNRPVSIELESLSLIARLIPRLRRLSCILKLPSSANIQTSEAPGFPCLQVLRISTIIFGPGDQQWVSEWFSQWHLPVLRQLYVPRYWECYLELLDRGVGAQLKVLEVVRLLRSLSNYWITEYWNHSIMMYTLYYRCGAVVLKLTLSYAPMHRFHYLQTNERCAVFSSPPFVNHLAPNSPSFGQVSITCVNPWTTASRSNSRNSRGNIGSMHIGALVIPKIPFLTSEASSGLGRRLHSTSRCKCWIKME